MIPLKRIRGKVGRWLIIGKNNMSAEGGHVCPVERAGSLDNRIRRWVQNPRKLLEPYVKEGMTVLDIGCGPGFFSREMARLVGPSGRVIAADMQEGMLRKLEEKIRSTELEERIILHKCGENTTGVKEKVDFVLAFYMVHEVPGPGNFLSEIELLLKPGGQLLIVEPPFHVSKKAFQEIVGIARESGFAVVDKPMVFLSKTVLLRKSFSSTPD